MEYFFEKMAARGWMLRDARGSFWGFERQTPKDVKFSVAILKDVSMWEGSENEESRNFQFYCESAGWHFVCAEKCRQILWSDDRDIVPIETDEEMKMEAVKTQYRKQAAFTMFVGVLWTLIYFWPVLAGGAELGGYLMKSLLESNAGILVLFCILYLLLGGLAGIVSYLVWCQMAKRNLSRKMPVLYRPYSVFMVKDIAEKVFCLLLVVLFYITVVRVTVQERDWRTLTNLLVFFIVFWGVSLFSQSRRKKGFRWRYLAAGMAGGMIMMFWVYKMDLYFDMEPSGEDTWMTGNGPFLKCSELFAGNKNAEGEETEKKEAEDREEGRSVHTRNASILLESESYNTFPSEICREDFSYTLYKSRYKAVLNYIRKLSENRRGYEEDGDYWDGSIYIRRYSDQRGIPMEQETADGAAAGDVPAEVIYRISVLRNGPYILVIRYKDQGPGLSKEIVDSRAADKMKRLPGIL